jgi:hypothetical protein
LQSSANPSFFSFSRSFPSSLDSFFPVRILFKTMPKQYISEIGLPKAKVESFASGNPITVTVDDMEGGDLFHSHFTKLKHLNEFKKNLSNGKSFRMTAAKVKDLVDPQSGGSILGSISRGLSSVGKALSSKDATNSYRDIGEEVAINVASSALGAGIGSDVKKVGRRIANSSAGKQLGKIAVEHGAKLISKKTGSSAVGNVVRQAGNAVLGGKSLRGVARDVIRSEPAQNLGRAVVRAGANEIGRRTGSEAIGRAAQMAGERGLARASGGNLLGNTLGVIKKVGSTLGKGYGPVNPFNLGYDLGHDVIAPAIMAGSGVGSRIDPGLGGARISFHDGTPLWKFAARRQSGGSFAPLG